jgi:recombination protein RecT
MGNTNSLYQRNEQANVNTMLAKMEDQFKMALPKHIPIDRFMRVTITEIRRNSELGQCTPISLIGALMQAAQDGLEPGIDGQCWLIPRWNSKLKSLEVNYQRGYQGILTMARNTGEYAKIIVRSVHVKDYFDYEEGSNSYLKYKRTLKERGEAYAYFCYTKLKNGEDSFTVIAKKDAENHRDLYAPRNKNGDIVGPWIDDFDAMAMKSVLIMHLKYQPKSTEVRDLMKAEDRVINYDPEVGLIPQENNFTNVKVKPNLKIPESKKLSEYQEKLKSFLENNKYDDAVKSAIAEGRFVKKDEYSNEDAKKAIAVIEEFKGLIESAGG